MTEQFGPSSGRENYSLGHGYKGKFRVSQRNLGNSRLMRKAGEKSGVSVV